jgi:hypothetical protein
MLNNFYTAFVNYCPLGVTWTVPGSGEVLDIGTGKPKGAWSQGGNGTKVSNGSANYAAGVGARVQWVTAGWNNGRRVKGSTYIVPLAFDEYDVDGTIKPAVVTAAGTAATALITAAGGGLMVWSRGPGAGSGSISPVVTGNMPDKVSWLRSRRT